MRPARLSARTRSHVRRKTRASVVISQRSADHRRRPLRAATVSAHRYGAELLLVFKRLLTALLGLFLVCGGTWLLVIAVFLPQFLFARHSTQIVAFIPETATTPVLLMRIEPNWQDSQLWWVSGSVVPSQSENLAARALSQQFGVLIELAIPLNIAFSDEADTVLNSVLQGESATERLQQLRSESGYAVEQLRQVLGVHQEEIAHKTLEEMRSEPLVPVINPAESTRCPVAVANATKISGLAEDASRILERSGLLVVKTVSATEPLSITRLRVSEKLSTECEEIVSVLTRSLRVERLPAQSSEQPLFDQYRADILLELGDDWNRQEATGG